MCSSYLRFEWEARKRPDLDAKLQARIAEMRSAGSEKEEEEVDFDEEKWKKGLEMRRKRVFDNIPVIKCKVSVPRTASARRSVC